MCYYYLCICRYVDVILQLIDKAGDFVSDDIWYRVVQFVTNNEDLQVKFNPFLIVNVIPCSFNILAKLSLTIALTVIRSIKS